MLNMLIIITSGLTATEAAEGPQCELVRKKSPRAKIVHVISIGVLTCCNWRRYPTGITNSDHLWDMLSKLAWNLSLASRMIDPTTGYFASPLSYSRSSAKGQCSRVVIVRITPGMELYSNIWLLTNGGVRYI